MRETRFKYLIGDIINLNQNMGKLDGPWITIMFFVVFIDCVINVDASE